MIILTKAQLLLLHKQLHTLTGGAEGLREEGMLESAMAAPFQTFGEIDLYPTVKEKAARLCYGLVKNHPFMDGNKRIGVHAMLVFLALNGIRLKYTQKELADTILALAASELSQEALLAWIGAHRE